MVWLEDRLPWCWVQSFQNVILTFRNSSDVLVLVTYGFERKVAY